MKIGVEISTQTSCINLLESNDNVEGKVNTKANGVNEYNQDVDGGEQLKTHGEVDELVTVQSQEEKELNPVTESDGSYNNNIENIADRAEAYLKTKVTNLEKSFSNNENDFEDKRRESIKMLKVCFFFHDITSIVLIC